VTNDLNAIARRSPEVWSLLALVHECHAPMIGTMGGL
jgi:hypothetical protein